MCYIHMMKNISGFWVLFLVVGTALMALYFSCSTRSMSVPDVAFADDGGTIRTAATSRKLTEYGYNPSNIGDNTDAQKVNLEDYHLVDPAPSSKASLKPKPVDHGTPVGPYIPKYPPPPPSAAAPDHPRTVGSPP